MALNRVEHMCPCMKTWMCHKQSFLEIFSFNALERIILDACIQQCFKIWLMVCKWYESKNRFIFDVEFCSNKTKDYFYKNLFAREKFGKLNEIMLIFHELNCNFHFSIKLFNWACLAKCDYLVKLTSRSDIIRTMKFDPSRI